MRSLGIVMTAMLAAGCASGPAAGGSGAPTAATAAQWRVRVLGAT